MSDLHTRVEVVLRAGATNPTDVQLHTAATTWTDVFLFAVTADGDIRLRPVGSLAPIVTVAEPPVGGTDELTATSPGASTTTATTLVRALAFTATTTGVSTTAATMVRARPLAATSVGTSTTTAALASADSLTGVSAGGSVTSAALILTRGLTSTSTGTSATAGDLTVTPGVTATPQTTGRGTRVMQPAWTPEPLTIPDTFPPEWAADRDDDALMLLLLAELT